MTKKWTVGLIGAFAVLALTGVGFSAFTASATVNGTASAATVGLAIVENSTSGCTGFYANNASNGTIAFSDLSEAGTSVSLNVANLVPGEVCFAYLTLENTGSVPLNLSVTLNNPGYNGLCAGGQNDCYDVNTLSGIEDSGWVAFCGPCSFAPLYSVTGFTVLNPGQTYSDSILVDIPLGSDNGTPASGAFSLVYTGSAGF